MANLMDSISKSSSELYNLRVVTAIRFAETAISGITSMTYLFDPNWSATLGAQQGNTLPIAFFDTLTESVTQSNEISTRRVMVYEGTGESDREALSTEIKPASLNAISDNVVVSPLEKEVEVLIPYGSLTFIFSRVSALLDAIPIIMLNTGRVQGMARSTANVMLTVSNSLKSIVRAFSSLQSLTGKIGGFSGERLNIDSLLSMARNRSVLLYKTYDSWEFKYVVIKNIKATKKGTERNYMRCSLTLVEVPILAVGSFNLSKAYPKTRSLIGKALQTAIQKFVNTSKSVLTDIGE